MTNTRSAVEATGAADSPDGYKGIDKRPQRSQRAGKGCRAAEHSKPQQTAANAIRPREQYKRAESLAQRPGEGRKRPEGRRGPRSEGRGRTGYWRGERGQGRGRKEIGAAKHGK